MLAPKQERSHGNPNMEHEIENSPPKAKKPKTPRDPSSRFSNLFLFK